MGEVGTPPLTPVSSCVSSPSPKPGRQADSLHPLLPRQDPTVPLCFFSVVSQRSICLIFPSLLCFSLNWEAGMRAEKELKPNPSQGERWTCQDIYLTCQLDISSKCLLISHFFFLLMPFKLIDCMDINCLYIWGRKSVHSEFIFKMNIKLWLWPCCTHQTQVDWGEKNSYTLLSCSHYGLR